MLGRHHIVGTAIGLAGDDGHLGHGAFGVGVEQLGAVLDDATVLLAGAGHEARDIDERDHGDVKGIAKAHEPCSLDRALDVQAAGQHQGLVGDDAHRLAVHAGKADDDVLGIVGGDFEEVTIVDRLEHKLLHVVGLVRVVGHQGVQAQIGPIDRIAAGANRRLLAVAQRQVVVEPAQHEQGLDIVVESTVGHAALGGVRDGPAKLLGGHFLVRHRLDHLGARDKHVGAVFDHEDEVGHRWRVDRPAGARTHDQADLRNHA